MGRLELINSFKILVWKIGDMELFIVKGNVLEDVYLRRMIMSFVGYIALEMFWRYLRKDIECY